MNKREKILAVAVCGLLVLVGGVFGWRKIDDAFAGRTEEIERLSKQTTGPRSTVQRGKAADRRLADYKRRSLPRDPDLARSLYQKWLLESIDRVGLKRVDVSVAEARGLRGQTYRKLIGRVNVQGDLEQLTEFLYRFYRLDHLHQIKLLSVTPIQESKQLKLALTLEAISLADGKPRQTLEAEPADRLAWDELSQYTDVIVGRNLLAPANNPPGLKYVGDQQMRTDRPLSIEISAADLDPLDAIRFSLGEGAPEGAEIDPESGQFRFATSTPGEYAVTVVAADNGLPPKSDSETFTISATEPPPPPEPDVDPPPAVAQKSDDFKFVLVSGITEINGRGQMWLRYLKTETTQKLFEGDPFEIGTLSGVIHRIDVDRNEGELTADGQRLLVAHGKKLSEGLPLDDGGP